ncbi:MAG: hypothetical protein ACOYJ6_04380 [Caulobacterales bacterium]|jgi:hypothetical protein
MAPSAYLGRWRRWSDDPLIGAAGVSFERAPSGAIRAAPRHFRVCAYHIDTPERPVCWLDVASRDEAAFVRDHLGETAAGWNVDVAAVFDESGGPID